MPGVSLAPGCNSPEPVFSRLMEAPASADRVRRVFDAAEAFLDRQAVNGDQRQLLGRPVARLRSALEEEREGAGIAPFVYLPSLVYAGLRGEERPAIALAVATTLLFVGIDLFDDVADGDWPASAPGCTAAEANLAAATLLCALPQLAIAELDAPPFVVSAMQRTLAQGLLRMSAGQQHDLRSTGARDVCSAGIEAAVVAKSGEEAALFARLAAQLAEAPDGVAEIYEDMGRAIGAGAQLASDCYELFSDPAARDLAHGARTLPIALEIERLDGAERTAFLDLLDQARQKEEARNTVRSRLRSRGPLRQCAFIVETYRQRALRLCRHANPLEPARRGLEAMIGSIGFFP